MEEIVQEQLLEIKHLEKSYGEDSPVLKDISLSVKKGEVVVLLGPSGCGKSTLLRTIMGLEHIQGGEILLEGKNIVGKSEEARKERQNLGMVSSHEYHGEPSSGAHEGTGQKEGGGCAGSQGAFGQSPSF